jgi:uncharacterized protein YkwD
VLIRYPAVTHQSGRRSAPLLIALATGALLASVGSLIGGGSLPAGLASVLGVSASADPTLPVRSPPPTPVPMPTSAALGLPTLPVAPPTSSAGAAAPEPTRARTTTVAPRPTTTTPNPAPRTPAAPAPAPPSGPAAQVVELTNQQRTRNGCGALRVDARITAAAQKHSADMSANGYFSHDSQDGRTFDQRIRAEGYPSPGAENIAQGQRSAAEVVQAWMNSPGHRRNILDCSLTTIGVGWASTGNYWTQDFGR